MKSAAAISFEWKASRRLQGSAAIVCALACLAIGLSDLPLPAVAAAIAVFVPVAALQLHRYSRSSCVRISGSELGWQLFDHGHAAMPAVLQRHRSLGPFEQLHSLSHGRHRHFLGAPDNVDADTRRRLRLLLARLPSA